jgi:ribosomal protein S18 acetylase RimI-like enzyme
MDPALHEILAGWGDFYLITGTAAAALTGLQFVVQSLLAADLQTRRETGDAEGSIAAFGSPTIVHFTLAVAISCLLCMPWPTPIGLRESLGALGLGGLVYCMVVWWRARKVTIYTPVAEDWAWHVLLPAAAYAAVVVASVLFRKTTTGPLFAVALGTLVLLCVGIHNAWDTVIFITVTSLSRRRSDTPQPGASGEPVARADSTDRPVIIRPAAVADLPVIGKLGAMLVREHHAFDPARFIAATPLTEQHYAEFIGSQLGRPGVLLLVGERRGVVVAYVYAGLEGTDYMALRGPAGALYDIIVDPENRGEGVGRQLLDAVLHELARKGAPRVVLSTADRNEPAQRLFARAGFRRTMVEMTKELRAES